jgi:hypothetical protein
MPFPVSLRTRDGAIQAFVDRNPGECPVCHVAITPIDTNVAAKTVSRGGVVIAERVFVCPNEKCEHIFIARYKFAGRTLENQEQFQLYACLPVEIANPTQSETITKVSPDFCSIYAQAYKAEQYGLVLVAGPGYRKALEFLIKDYIISGFTETGEALAVKKSTVEKMQLANCSDLH